VEVLTSAVNVSYLDAVARQALVAKRIPSVSCARSNQLLNSISGSVNSSDLTSSRLSYINDVTGSCGLGVSGCRMSSGNGSTVDVTHTIIHVLAIYYTVSPTLQSFYWD